MYTARNTCFNEIAIIDRSIFNQDEVKFIQTFPHGNLTYSVNSCQKGTLQPFFIIFIIIIIYKKVQNVTVIINYQYLLVTRSTA